MMPGHWEGAVDTQWYKVWENAEILAVYKPALLPVSRTTRNLYNTLIQLVRRQTPFYDAHLLHRLDTETDGLILIAKDKDADRKWKKQLDQLIERKIYHAVVSGHPEWLSTEFECELSERLDSAIRSQVYVAGAQSSALYRKPRWSKTAFRVLSRDDDTSLIECELFTGRKHQIRTQLAFLGYPIIGDKIYAHDGRFYLKRLEAPLSEGDYEVLQSSHHRLTAVELVIRPDAESPSIRLRLNQI
ncbi:MAG: RNA pseudouridine synthase [Oceanospirillaceae bacterium]|nr:RNA pseudouridine synthase [Oceanospirillaceae bacterium]